MDGRTHHRHQLLRHAVRHHQRLRSAGAGKRRTLAEMMLQVAAYHSIRRPTMKADFFRKHGGPEVMEYGDMPDPVAGAGQVLIDVHAASVNGADWKVRKGSYAPLETFPYIPGRDFSGVVSA